MKYLPHLLALSLACGQTDKTADAVELVVYSDFQCPFCSQFAQPVEQFRQKGVEGIATKVTFKNFPLNFHADAKLAAQASQAAAAQGKFWEMHDLLFANQSALKRESLLGYGQILDPSEIERRVFSVTPEDVQHTACYCLNRAKLGLAVVGPLKDESRIRSWLG